ncbi:Retrovirus-related Pol polyprotein from transposon TNT 1-94 [Dendrobium catenatum]|uniref:Retrovirus-related Pol polyprotein from transposon TNT 1-94 n=1 Tax=Dendrobium catenatum TaxID=906689 RepID=A0A2I0WSH0_9ASPA|nr:Retrovirus-related Pol polyprotein from transposon TNT 1-94 [Dendrobium catenatum]
MVDNKSAIAMSKNPVYHGRSKHIDTRYHFIRSYIEKKQIEVEYIRTEEQLADIFTKSLGRVKFIEMIKNIGLKSCKFE